MQARGRLDIEDPAPIHAFPGGHAAPRALAHRYGRPAPFLSALTAAALFVAYAHGCERRLSGSGHAGAELGISQSVDGMRAQGGEQGIVVQSLDGTVAEILKKGPRKSRELLSDWRWPSANGLSALLFRAWRTCA